MPGPRPPSEITFQVGDSIARSVLSTCEKGPVGGAILSMGKLSKEAANRRVGAEGRAQPRTGTRM